MSSNIVQKPFAFASPRPQCFSFPPDVITHLWKNPVSPDGLQKLYQTCKYFFKKCQIMIFEKAIYFNGKLSLCFASPEIDIRCKSAKFWFNNYLFITGSYSIEQIYRCSVNMLTLVNTILLLDDFNILISENTVTTFCFNYSTIVDSNNKMLPIYVILEKLINIVDFRYWNPEEKYTSETLENLLNVNLKYKLKKFILELTDIPQCFNPPIFCNFLQKNLAHNSEICLGIYGNNSLEMKTILKTFIVSMVDQWDGGKPVFKFDWEIL